MKRWVDAYLNSYEGLNRPAWMLALTILINRSGAMVIPFLGVYMSQALHFNLKDTGNVLTGFGLGAVCGSSLGGWLTDRIGHFKVQIWSLLLCIPVYCSLPQLTTPTQLAIGVFILSLITESFRPANSVAIATYTEAHNITKAFSLNRMAVNLGFSIGPALGGFLASVSYKLLFYGNAASSLLAAILFYLSFWKMEGQKNTPKTIANDKSLSPWRDHPYLVFSVMCCLYGICFFQILNLLPLFYKEVHRLSEYEIGIIMAFSGFVVFLLEMPLVHLAERRFTSTAAIVVGTLLCGASFAMLLLPGKYLLLYCSIFVVCISEILALPFMATVAMKRAPASKQGAYMGLNSLCYSVALILSPYLGTRIAYRFGFDTLWLATGCLTIIVALAFHQILIRLNRK